MSIAEFYLDHGIDPGDPDHMDKFLASQFPDFDHDEHPVGQAGTDHVVAALERYRDTHPGPFTQYDIPPSIDEVYACEAKYAAKAIAVLQLTEYNVQGLPVSPQGLRLLAECLRTNTSLLKLQLESEECYKIGEAYKDLGDALRENTSLRELSIVHHPQATAAQERILIDAVAANKSLRKVCIDDMSQEGKILLSKVMKDRLSAEKNNKAGEQQEYETDENEKTDKAHGNDTESQRDPKKQKLGGQDKE
jgi:hypothetical protein